MTVTAKLTLDPAHTALLIMDYQNEVIGRYLEHAPGLLDRAATVLDAARAAGVGVYYVVVRFRPGYPEISARNKTFRTVRENAMLREGTPEAEIHARVAPRPDEVVVTKRRVGAFGTTDLDTVLRAREVTTLVLVGVATSGVVLSTIRWTADADYELVVVEDCCADNDAEVHRVLMGKVFPRQAAVVQSDAVLEALKNAALA